MILFLLFHINFFFFIESIEYSIIHSILAYFNNKNLDVPHTVLFWMPIKLKNWDRYVMNLLIFIWSMQYLLKPDFVFFKIFVFTKVWQNDVKKRCVSSSSSLLLFFQQTFLLYLNWLIYQSKVLFFYFDIRKIFF